MTTPSCRQPAFMEVKDQPEFCRVLHKTGSADATLSIVVDGAQFMFSLNRRLVLGLISSGAEYLRELEPSR